VAVDRPPRVGISAGLKSRTERYERAVSQAGAEPVVLRPGDPIVDIDGLVLAGGPDVDPQRFGEDVPAELAGLVEVDAARDQHEWDLLDHAARHALPVLGICRGIQVLNVYCGGTLHLDLPAAGFHAIDHQQRELRAEPVHVVNVVGGALRSLMGAERAVNSIHHQGVRRVGEGLAVTACSEDGLVEGIENVDGRMWGIQWHPEELVGTSGAARAIFDALVARAGAGTP
jgi:putative glutamine amidotransferase